jgi:hypothetical protein
MIGLHNWLDNHNGFYGLYCTSCTSIKTPYLVETCIPLTEVTYSLKPGYQLTVADMKQLEGGHTSKKHCAPQLS